VWAGAWFSKPLHNSANLIVGKHRHELTGPIAFAAWLGVHAALLTTLRASIGSVIDWAWNYFGNGRDTRILDRPSGRAFYWGEEEESEPTSSA